jgi:hypothetical protein
MSADDDDDALNRCIAIIRARQGRKTFVDELEKRKGRRRMAVFCAAILQAEALGLRPGSIVPANSEPRDLYHHDKHRRRAAEMAEKLEEAGLSRYEPDPTAALAEYV